MTRENVHNKSIIWVYPPNNWVSNYNKTFIYGWCDPKTRLFVSVKEAKVKIFPNGNFAQSIRLPSTKNKIKLIQICKGKKKILSRTVIVRKSKGLTKQSYIVRGLLRRHYIPLRNDIVIVIDPGHGGSEHGTHSPKGIPESYFNLEIAKLLYKRLKTKYKKVYLTRTKDKFLSLKQRVNFAKNKKCNLLISIHHNALPDYENPLKHKGIEIYYTHNFVKPLANTLLESISRSSGLKKYGIFKRNFALTRVDFCYGVLIECGFLIHPEESEIITQRKTQEKIVGGILRALTKIV